MCNMFQALVRTEHAVFTTLRSELQTGICNLLTSQVMASLRDCLKKKHSQLHSRNLRCHSLRCNGQNQGINYALILIPPLKPLIIKGTEAERADSYKLQESSCDINAELDQGHCCYSHKGPVGALLH